MIIGVPKETAPDENRIGLTPQNVSRLRARGHRILVESNAGAAVGMPDQDYLAAGAERVDGPAALFAQSDLIVKVREPQTPEFELLRGDQVLFSFLQPAANPELAAALLQAGTVAIACEAITGAHASLPLLAPISAMAGRLAVQAGARQLEGSAGGRAIALGGAPGVLPGRVVIVGAGVAGESAARLALAMGAAVTLVDIDTERLRRLQDGFGNRVATLYSDPADLGGALENADLAIACAARPDAPAPRLISRAMVARMPAGSVLVDLAIDRGGNAETSRATTLRQPTFIQNGVIHHCVPNLTASVARSATLALNHAGIEHIIALADHGWLAACRASRHLRNGLALCRGKITQAAVARALEREHTSADLLCSPMVP